jgi:DNA repair and recombination protein RAD54B
MLHSLHENTDEKVVIVSNFTSTLNIIAKVCEAKRYPALRLDGSTPQKQRLELVDRFNRGRRDDSYIFLLSAKAGGVGLNLIG